MVAMIFFIVIFPLQMNPWHTPGRLLHGCVTVSPQHGVSSLLFQHQPSREQGAREVSPNLCPREPECSPSSLHSKSCSPWVYTHKSVAAAVTLQPCPGSRVCCTLLSAAVLLQKISTGIPLPPAQVPPSLLHVKQKPGNPWAGTSVGEAVPKPRSLGDVGRWWPHCSLC